METILNHKKFAERLQELMDKHGLSAAAFAEELEVGRATISHLMSGRNKPSLDFVIKVVSTFKSVDLSWLIFGEDATIKSVSKTTSTPAVNSTNNPNILDHIQPTLKAGNSKKVSPLKRVILLKEDGTFESYEV